MKLNRLKCGLFVCSALAGTGAMAMDYHVGPNQKYTDLASVPFESLRPGDNVLIHFKPGGYHESFLLMTSGTVDRHITVRGIPDPVTGRKPIIDGSNAKVGPSINKGYYPFLNPYGGIIIAPAKVFTWGDAPSFIDIDGLEICNFNMRNKMTYNGTTQPWDKFACGIYGERVRHLTVKNCSLHTNGNGFYCNSKYGAAAASGDLLIQNNTFAFNGNPGSMTEHHLYTECAGIIIEQNTFGPFYPGSYGAAIKDRSAGTVVRYNSMQVSKYGCSLYLVNPQGGAGYLETLPTFKKTYVYGNAFYNPPVGGEAFIIYGGEAGSWATARRGTLYSYHNTFVNHADGTGAKKRIGCIAYRLNTMAEYSGHPVDQMVDSRNNVFYCVSETKGVTPTDLYMVYAGGSPTINFGRDWVSPTAKEYLTPTGWTGPFPNLTGNLFPHDKYNTPGLTDPTLYARATTHTAYLGIASPATRLSLIDPNVLIRNIDLKNLWKAMDMDALAKVIDPKLVVGVIDPNELSAIVDPNFLIGLLRPADFFKLIDPNNRGGQMAMNSYGLLNPPSDFVGVIDPNEFGGLVDPYLAVGLIDPNERPSLMAPYGASGMGPSVLIGAAGPLASDLPAMYKPTMEYRPSTRNSVGWKLRVAKGNFSIGAFEPQQ